MQSSTVSVELGACSARVVRSSSTLEAWKVAIVAANDAVIHGDYPQAFAQYEVALVLAEAGVEALLQTWQGESVPDMERKIAALVVTHHNVANLHRQCDQISSAVAHVCAAHEAVFRLLHHPQSDIHSLVLPHLRVTHRELMVFTQAYGMLAAIEHTLALTEYVCEPCRHKKSH